MGSGALPVPAVLGFGFVFWVFVGLPFSSKQYVGIPLDLVASWVAAQLLGCWWLGQIICFLEYFVYISCIFRCYEF